MKRNFVANVYYLVSNDGKDRDRKNRDKGTEGLKDSCLTNQQICGGTEFQPHQAKALVGDQGFFLYNSIVRVVGVIFCNEDLY